MPAHRAAPAVADRSRSAPGRLLDAAAPRVSLGDVVAERLREAILSDELKPGQPLREEDISERLRVSRGPVRDAFIILEREGLVSRESHRGAKVVELSLDDLGEVYSLRLSIEELAVRLAIRRGDAADLDAVDASLSDLRSGLRRRLTEQEAARLDVEFHDAIFRAAHHERLYASWRAIRMQVYWFLCSRNIANADWRVATVGGHQEILDLIRGGKERPATAAIRFHITSAYTRIINQLTAEDPAGPDAAEIVQVAKSFLLT
ncbi:GntR family transcriptional regulator [Nakamurella endophytica]|uniref:GntR family transcriptional regulator n=1 Tax=Nakamurella endophytica TaxID=1748367 RepID=A0A917SW35_9ACTN|nr:GntR family transcriptional regulator [Nakamurella endophytica]GGL99429.1 GntR family transcriptional regulator [Nakamurella endophytica]